jgi:hypothetical protein
MAETIYFVSALSPQANDVSLAHKEKKSNTSPGHGVKTRQHIAYKISAEKYSPFLTIRGGQEHQIQCSTNDHFYKLKT